MLKIFARKTFVWQLIKLRHVGLLWQFKKAPNTKVCCWGRVLQPGLSGGVRATLAAAGGPCLHTSLDGWIYTHTR